MNRLVIRFVVGAACAAVAGALAAWIVSRRGSVFEDWALEPEDRDPYLVGLLRGRDYGRE